MWKTPFVSCPCGFLFSPTPVRHREPADTHTTAEEEEEEEKTRRIVRRTRAPVEASPYLDIIVLAVFRHPRQVLVALHQGSLAGRDFLL